MAAIHDKFKKALIHNGASDRTAREYARVAAKADPDGRGTKASMAVWYADTVRAKSRSTQTVYKAALRHWCAFRGLGDVDLPKPRGAKTNRFRAALSEEEYAILIQAIQASEMPVPAKVILMLIPETGLRISEACSLHWSQHEQHGDGRRAFRLAGKGDKIRVIPLNDTAQAILNRYCRWARTPVAGYLFPSDQGREGFYSPKTVRAHLSALAAEHGWRGRLATVSPHVLRHTFASRLLNRGVSIRIIQDLLGHGSIKTTERYTHPDDAALDEATRALGQRPKKRGPSR